MNRRLDEQALSHGVMLTAPDGNDRLREPVFHLAERGQVVALIDEYDKPILDQIGNLGVQLQVRYVVRHITHL